MKTRSPRAAELVARLQRPPSWRERVLGRVEEELRILAELADCAEPALVPFLAPLAFAGPVELRRAAVTATDRALATATPADLLQLDEACRRIGWGFETPWQDDWRTLRNVQLTAPSLVELMTPRVFGVASFHPNGRIREAAVARLDWYEDGSELPFLLIRVNDWVDAVATRALGAVETRITPAYASAWVTWLPLLRRLDARTRRSADGLVERVIALLRAPEQRRVLLAALAEERGTRRLALRLLREGAAPAERVGVIQMALADEDPVVRVEAVTYASASIDPEELAAVAPRILADRFPGVRRAGLAAVAERMGDDAVRWLRCALLDRGATVRELARYYLRRRGLAQDFGAYYRDAIGEATTPARLAAAAEGLGETGGREDIARLLPLLGHERAPVRRAAVRAIGRLDAEGEQARLLAMLDDPAPGVTHAARDVLRRNPGALDAEWVRRAVREARQPHGRLDGLVLAGALPKWASISILLDAIGSEDERIREDARRRIATWLERQNQSFVRPSESQLVAFRASYQASSRTLEPATRAALQGAVAVWERT